MSTIASSSSLERYTDFLPAPTYVVFVVIKVCNVLEDTPYILAALFILETLPLKFVKLL